MTTEEDSIEQAAVARRERLKALREAQELLSKPDDGTVEGEEKNDDAAETDEEMNLNMKFRNYLPHDKQLQEGKLAPPVLPKFEDPVATSNLPSETTELHHPGPFCEYCSKEAQLGPPEGCPKEA
ncbi:hypothetical protein Syun_003586 [Stephania yunnanensis]|uniref:Uncharacterized protein n=1 Tax=Stephania yunnanensis TaxID=152371 RepID=A0AAP0Q1R4_9MAGN